MKTLTRKNKNNSVSLTITSEAKDVKKGLSRLTTKMRKVASDALHAAVIEAINRTRVYITESLPNKPKVANALNQSIHFNEKRIGSRAIVRSFRKVTGEATHIASRKTADLAALYNFGVKGKVMKGAVKGGKTKSGRRKAGVTGGVMVPGSGGAGAHQAKSLEITKLPRGGGIGGFALRETSGKGQSWLPLHHIKKIPALNYMDYCAKEFQSLFNYEVARGILALAVSEGGFYTPDLGVGLSSGVKREVSRQSRSMGMGKTPRRPRKGKSIQKGEKIKGASKGKKTRHFQRIRKASALISKQSASDRGLSSEADPMARRSGKAAKAMSRFSSGGK